ncbi:MAG: hypothetical protein GY778_15295 [bacterium]|nr:hypothetical protein [bacterium]
MAQSSSSTSHNHRAQGICTAGLVVQLLVFGGILILAAWTESQAVWAEAIHLAGPVLIWLALLIVYVQRKRAEAEDFETEELRRAAEAGTSAAIFETARETLHLERQRLAWLNRWFLPGFTIVLALVHIGVYVTWQAMFAKPLDDPGWSRATNPALAMTIIGMPMVFCFMFSRYASGMAREPQWRMLRAASTYLAGNALACLVIFAALGLSKLGVDWAEPAAVYVIYVVLGVLGVEFGINFVLDLYRPKTADDLARPAFDSRLLALVTEPGGMARSMADAINYQFGFEVSGTWFYQLLGRAMLPLAVFTLLALVALSSVVIVDADQQAVVERFGQRVGQTVLEPGPNLKSPWPIDRVYRANVRQARSLLVGSHSLGQDDDEPEGAAGHDEHHEEDDHEIILWTQQHDFSGHTELLVAGPQGLHASGGDREAGDSGAVGVAMVMCSVGVQYRISNLDDHLYNYQDPEAVLESVAYQALTDYAASVELDQVIGPGRMEFEQGLGKTIRQRIAGLGLGVEIIFVGLQGAHPPAKEGVAKAFQDVVAAERIKQATIVRARGQADIIKTKVAGSVGRADLLDEAIREMDRLASTQDTDPEALAAARQRVDDLLLGNPATGSGRMGGQVVADLAEAEAARTALLSEAESKRRVFANELAAYQAAPKLYRMRKYLEVLQRSVAGIRKFVLVGDRTQTDLIIEIETESPNLLDLSEPGPEGT